MITYAQQRMSDERIRCLINSELSFYYTHYTHVWIKIMIIIIIKTKNMNIQFLHYHIQAYIYFTLPDKYKKKIMNSFVWCTRLRLLSHDIFRLLSLITLLSLLICTCRHFHRLCHSSYIYNMYEYKYIIINDNSNNLQLNNSYLSMKIYLSQFFFNFSVFNILAKFFEISFLQVHSLHAQHALVHSTQCYNNDFGCTTNRWSCQIENYYHYYCD